MDTIEANNSMIRSTHTWCSMRCPDVIKQFGSGEDGLTVLEAEERLKHYGENKLEESKPDSILKIFIRQFQSPLLYILMFAGIVALALGEITDGLIIIGVLVLNSVIGAFQEGRAQDSLFALRKYTKTNVLVMRDGEHKLIPSEQVVPGDILILKEGDKIPADARIAKSVNLTTEEAVLTGESVPIQKTEGPIAGENILISDQTNMVWAGTHVTRGSGNAVVVATGTKTEIGKIAEQIGQIDTEIPLKTNIRRLARVIIGIVFLFVAALFIVGISSGQSPREMLLVAIALTVSVIPEGLPVVMTLVLATGVSRMSKKNVLVKKLQAVDALGQAHIIAVDKTGTLTKNELVVQQVFVDNTLFDITGTGYEPKGNAVLDGENVNTNPILQKLSLYAGLSANAELFKTDDEYKVNGDPTEAAMLVFGEKFGNRKKELLESSPLVSELPFDYQKKYYANVHRHADKNLMIITGAPEVILQKSRYAQLNSRRSKITDEKIEKTLEKVVHMSAQGLRVIALAVKTGAPDNIHDEDVEGLTFIGLMGMKDALREEVGDAMKAAQGAGMKVVMITGDHKITAAAIAREAGIYSGGDKVMEGRQITKLSDEELERMIDGVTVFARVTPDQKLRIIEAYKRRGDIIAMTGDGVNDVSSLVSANLGVAMGRIGTEVTKEASDIVLLDDNFGNIPHAVEEGRHIYTSIKKVLVYLLSTNLGEVFVITFAVLWALPVPLTPAQIIWLNLITDSFLVIALGLEPKESNLLRAGFKKPGAWMIDKLMLLRMILMAGTMTVGTLFVFKAFLDDGFVLASTIALMVLAMYQVFNAWNARSNKRSIFDENPFKNKALVGAAIFAVGLQLFAVYTPFMQKLLDTTALTWQQWGIIVPVALSIVVVEEIRKYIVKLIDKRKKKS